MRVRLIWCFQITPAGWAGGSAVISGNSRGNVVFDTARVYSERASCLPGSKSSAFRKPRQSGAWPCFCGLTGQADTHHVHSDLRQEHNDEFWTRLILPMCKCGALGLGCNQGVFVNTSTVFDLENSEDDGLVRWFSEWYCFLTRENSKWSILKREKKVCDFLRNQE